MKPLQREFYYFQAHQEELVQKYRDKWIVIYGIEIIGVYETQIEAVQDSLDNGLEPGTFFVHHCVINPKEYIFHSRMGKIMKPLQQEFYFFYAHREELVQQYEDKWIVIQGIEVGGVYDDELEAINDSIDKGMELGTFFVEQCTKEPKRYVVQSRARIDNVFA